MSRERDQVQSRTETPTFLFTDIEGSTRLWERSAEAMSQALVRHDQLLREVIEAAHGRVFKTMGDAFCAVFHEPLQAIRAAVAGQRALLAEPWPGDGQIRVRMAVHTGFAEERDGDYFGRTLNRVARLLALGHGGQILLSLATQELVRDYLADELSLRDMGMRRLKDLTRPEQVHQLVIAGMPADFPPLRGLDARPNNLPVQSTPFIGRQRETQAVCEILRKPGVRWVTLTGPGGTGKTRLALQVAAELADELEHGVFFVALAPLTDPSLVLPTIAQTLGLKETGERPLADGLRDHLRGKHVLLVLDNFEQILAAAPDVADLLGVADGLEILITSRALTRTYGEHDFPVPPLQLPDPRHLPPLDRLTQYEAVRLFIDRAVAVQPRFQITNDNAPAIAAICARLDGLPLAIELAAARSRLLPPQALLSKLEHRLPLLTSGGADRPARQQTLRGAIDWSHGLLDGPEQVLFRRLSVFIGGFSLDACAEVCAADQDGLIELGLDPLDGVEGLVQQSLLRVEPDAAAEPRLGMLETIREYAQGQLSVSGEAALLRRRHALYFSTLAGRAAPYLFQAEQAHWLARLEADHDNLRGALQWAIEHDPEVGLRLAGALWWFWWSHGHLGEGRRWLEVVLDRGRGLPAVFRVPAVHAAGAIALHQGDYGAARAWLEEGLALFRNLGDPSGVAMSLTHLGTLAEHQDDDERAIALFVESLALYRALQDGRGTAFVLNRLGEVARARGDHRRARELYTESLTLRREQEDKGAVVWSLHNLGYIALNEHDPATGCALFTEALTISRALEDPWAIALCLAGLAASTDAAASPERAGTLYGASEALREACGARLWPADRADYERGLAACRRRAEAASFEASWAGGRSLSLKQAVAYALGG